MPGAGTGASAVHYLSQHMQILFWLSRVFSAFLPEYMCIASRMVMFRESSSPGHWLPWLHVEFCQQFFPFPGSLIETTAQGIRCILWQKNQFQGYSLWHNLLSVLMRHLPQLLLSHLLFIAMFLINLLSSYNKDGKLPTGPDSPIILHSAV